MDRQIVYASQQPSVTHLLNTNVFAMAALGRLAQDVFGTANLVTGFACTPTSPASMSVNIAPGDLYTFRAIDDTAYSALPADAHNILKQAVLADQATLLLTAPAGAGTSQVYLVQAAFSETDGANTVLAYYNSANPSQPFAGQNNNGVAQATLRTQKALVALKAGVAATTGTQVAPTADAGYVPLFAVTVANGQTTITSGNIVTAAGAPFLSATMPYLQSSFAALFAAAGLTPDYTNSSQLTTAVQNIAAAAGNGPFTNIASAATTDLGSLTSFNVNVTGTTGITSFGSSAVIGKPFYRVKFAGALTLTYNATSMILPGAANIVTAANDFCLLQYLGGGNWQMLAYFRSAAAPAHVPSGALTVGAAAAANGTIGSSGYEKKANGVIRQWATIQLADGGPGASANAVTWTYPIAFPNAVTGIKATNIGWLAAQTANGPVQAIFTAYTVGNASASIGTHNTGTAGTQTWFYVEVEGY